MEVPNNFLLRQARKLGIRNPGNYSASELQSQILRVRQLIKIRELAERLAIEVPDDAPNPGTVRRIVLAEIQRRLASVTIRSKIRYRGVVYVVERISAPQQLDGSRKFYLRSPDGRVHAVADIALLANLQKEGRI